MIDNLLYEFDFFKYSEAFNNCTSEEISQCVRCGFMSNVLILLHHLDNIRALYNRPIRISSLYRDMKHNHRVGGVSTSQHLKGAAVDIQPICKGNIIPASEIHLLADAVARYNEDACFISQFLIAANYLHIGLLDDSSERLNHYSIHFYEPKYNVETYELFKSRNYPIV